MNMRKLPPRLTRLQASSCSLFPEEINPLKMDFLWSIGHQFARDEDVDGFLGLEQGDFEHTLGNGCGVFPDAPDRVGLTGLRSSALPHHRTCGFPHPAVESSGLSPRAPTVE